MFVDMSRYLRRIFWHSLGCHPLGDPQIDQKNQFFDWLKLGHKFFLISAHIQETNVLTSLGDTTPPETPKRDPPKINFLIGLNYVPVFFISTDT